MLRVVLFLFGCIFTRLLLAALAVSVTNPRHRQAFLVLLTLIGASLIYQHISGHRKTGIETFGEPIWWDDLRPIHGSMYLTAAGLFAAGQNTWASILLSIDTLVGFTMFLLHHR